jgi:hypothetical protein
VHWCCSHSQFEGGFELLRHLSGLFCLDGTHGLNSAGYILYTLLGITDNKTGLPAACFWVPENHDHGHILAALQWIRTTVAARGPAWSVRVVMTDDDSKEFLALYKLDPAIHPRLCYFHVARNVYKMVKRSHPKKKAAAIEVKVLMGVMTTQPSCLKGRAVLLGAIQELLALFPSNTGARPDAGIVAAVLGELTFKYYAYPWYVN